VSRGVKDTRTVTEQRFCTPRTVFAIYSARIMLLTLRHVVSETITGVSNVATAPIFRSEGNQCSGMRDRM
jgi:hypothetical protein